METGDAICKTWPSMRGARLSPPEPAQDATLFSAARRRTRRLAGRRRCRWDLQILRRAAVHVSRLVHGHCHSDLGESRLSLFRECGLELSHALLQRLELSLHLLQEADEEARTSALATGVFLRQRTYFFAHALRISRMTALGHGASSRAREFRASKGTAIAMWRSCCRLAIGLPIGLAIGLGSSGLFQAETGVRS